MAAGTINANHINVATLDVQTAYLAGTQLNSLGRVLVSGTIDVVGANAGPYTVGERSIGIASATSRAVGGVTVLEVMLATGRVRTSTPLLATIVGLALPGYSLRVVIGDLAQNIGGINYYYNVFVYLYDTAGVSQVIYTASHKVALLAVDGF